MKRTFTFLLMLLLTVLHVYSQTQIDTGKFYIDTVGEESSMIFDDTPVGLGIEISDEQTYRNRHHSSHEVITPPTLVTKKKNDKGELYLKLYINADIVEVIARRINNSNRSKYKVFEKVILYPRGMPINSIRPIERFFQLNTAQSAAAAYATISSNTVSARQTHEFTMVEAKSGKVVSTIKIDYVFPKPQPEFLIFLAFLNCFLC